MTEQESLLARLDERSLHIMTRLDELTETLKHRCVSRAEFEPVRRLVYGATALVLSIVLGGLVAVAL